MVGLIAAAAVAVSSQIADVTVYNDRAQVVRTAEVELAQGMNTVRFEDLPETTDSRGLQVEGSGWATVLDVRFKVEPLSEVPKEAWRALYDERDELQLEDKRVEQRIAVLQEAKKLLSLIGTKVTHAGETESEPELDPGQWEKMLLLYTDKSSEYDEAILQAEVELKGIREELARVLGTIKAKGADSQKRRRVVEVDLEAAKAGVAELKLSYLVYGPKWVPTYDVRVDSEARSLEVKYFALVRQNTGEDWSNVALKLSTANPGLGGRHPELQPWNINMYSPRQVSSLKGGSLGVDKDASTLNTFGFGKSAGYDYEQVNLYSDSLVAGVEMLPKAEPQPDVQTRQSIAERTGASVVFAVPGRSTVESDDVEHRVAVSTIQLTASFRYSCVPKLETYAYLNAKAVNDGEHPFLAGKANIYLDGSFVATSLLELVAPGEEFRVFLGVDESIKVEHKLVKRYQSKEGLGGRYIRHTYEYQIVVKNTHATPEEVVVWDQLPISGSEGLEVKLLEPDYSRDTDALKMDDEQRLSWIRTMKSGEEWTIPFSFYIQAPKDMRIQGL